MATVYHPRMFCRSYINLVIRFSRRSSISILCVVLCYLLVHFINYIAAVAKLFFNTIKIYREYIINKGTKKKKYVQRSLRFIMLERGLLNVQQYIQTKGNRL